MPLPSKFRSPHDVKPQSLGKIPSPVSPKPETNQSTGLNDNAHSMSTDWNTTNDIRAQKLQTEHGLSKEDADDMTRLHDDDDHNDND